MDNKGSAIWILKAISDGLATNPNQIRLGIYIISGFIILLVITAILQTVRHSRELKRRSKQVYGFQKRIGTD
jgi:hypothetical protein